MQNAPLGAFCNTFDLPWSILQYFWPALSDNWSSFLSGPLRQSLLYNQQSIYIYAYKCLCQCVGKVYYQNVNMLGPIISEKYSPFFAPWVTSAHQSWKKSEGLWIQCIGSTIWPAHETLVLTAHAQSLL